MLDPSRISVKKFARTQEDNQDIPEIKFCEAFSIFGLLQFAISFFFIKFAFYGVYYWIPSYLQQVLFYSKKQATDIMSLGSIGGIIGSILMGTISDLLVVRSPVHTIGCVLGSISLLLLVSVQTNTHTAFLTGCMTSFSLFEGGATIVIAVVLCDIGKDELLRRKRRAVATISGINDGIAGFGSIIGQLLLGPISFLYGWKGVFIMYTGAALIACFPTIPYVVKEIQKYLRYREVERKR